MLIMRRKMWQAWKKVDNCRDRAAREWNFAVDATTPAKELWCAWAGNLAILFSATTPPDHNDYLTFSIVISTSAPSNQWPRSFTIFSSTTNRNFRKKALKAPGSATWLRNRNPFS
jgi:hypothetical protein